MSDTTISVIGKFLAFVLTSIALYLAPKVSTLLEARTSKTDREKIKILIDSFVQAAEQLLHDKDEDGSLRMDYVKNQLTALGIGLTADIIGMIEGAVWEVNNQNKQHISEKVNSNGNG